MAASKPKRGTSARRRTRPTPKPRSVKPGPPVAPEQVRLVPTKGTPGRGGSPGGESWRIEVDGNRAGVVFINVIDEPPIGRHASIQIFLNIASQGRRIGRVAYRLACEASAYDEIYAHMRKSNVASRRAAEEAGFNPAALPDQPQLVMVRCRGAPGAPCTSSSSFPA